jgi:TonB family protein
VRPLAISLALHALLLALWSAARPPPRVAWPSSSTPIEVTLTEPAPPPDPRASSARPALVIASTTHPSRDATRPPRDAEQPPRDVDAAPKTAAAASTPALAVMQGTSVPPDDSPSTPLPRGVDLFAAGALSSSLPPTRPSWGGTTRRAGDGSPPPGTRTAADDRAAGERIAGFLGEIQAAERVRAGRVPPAWRDVERGIASEYHPTPAAVTDESRWKTLARQWFTAEPHSAPTPRGYDVMNDHDRPYDFRAAQIAACQQAAAEPRGWRRTEVLVEVDADGVLRDAHVVMPSGRAALDRAALAAVRGAVARHPPRATCATPGCRVRTRWAVEAAVRVQPPNIAPVVNPVSGHLEGAMAPLVSFEFDETRGIGKVSYPFRRDVSTRVSLVGIEGAD